MNSDLTRRIAFTLGALLVYRIGLHVPLPGVDVEVWGQILRSPAGGGFADMLSIGPAGRVAIFSLGIGPYVTAAVVIQLMKLVSPTLRWLNKEGEKGRITLDQYTRYLAVLLAAVHSYGIAIALEGVTQTVTNPGFFFRMSTVVTLTGGVAFLIWLSDQITARGIGNGIVLMLFLGVVMDVPPAIADAFDVVGKGLLSVDYLAVVAALSVVAIGFIAFVELARRRVPIQFPRRQIGWRVFEDASTHLPLKINNAGVMPVVVGSWLLYVPMLAAAIFGYRAFANSLAPGQPISMLCSAAIIFLVVFIYTAFVLDPDGAAETLKRQQGAIPGVEPGEATAAHLDYVAARVTVLGAIYLLAVVLIPDFLFAYTQVPFYFSGVSAMVVVCTVLDITSRVQGAHVLRAGGITS